MRTARIERQTNTRQGYTLRGLAFALSGRQSRPLQQMVVQRAPASGGAVLRNNNESGELAISYADLALTDVSCSKAGGLANRQQCAQLAMDFYQRLWRANVLSYECFNLAAFAHDHPLPASMLNRREVLPHQVVNAPRVHAGQRASSADGEGLSISQPHDLPSFMSASELEVVGCDVLWKKYCIDVVVDSENI